MKPQNYEKKRNALIEKFKVKMSASPATRHTGRRILGRDRSKWKYF